MEKDSQLVVCKDLRTPGQAEHLVSRLPYNPDRGMSYSVVRPIKRDVIEC